MRSLDEPFSIEAGWSRTTVVTESEEAAATLSRVPGIHSVSIVERRPWSKIEDVINTGNEIFSPLVAGRRFAVRARRSGSQRSRVSFRSADVERLLGSELLVASAGVDLSNPEVTARVDVSHQYADYYTTILPAVGGLPLGVEGRGLSLVSGGFDSAVASWLMLRRGVNLDYLFFNLGGRAHQLGVLKVMEVIATRWSYGAKPKLIEVDFQPLVREIQERVTPKYWQVALKRWMLQAAEAVAHARKLPVLVTGDAVGQVSSQTIDNLRAIEHGTEIPILRPLVTYNKDEIVQQARKLGTFELSSAVGEYCAILPDRPATRTTVEVAVEESNNVPRELMIELLQGRRIYRLRALDQAALTAGLEVDHLPANAAVLDLRPKNDYQLWHLPGALHLDFDQALRAFRSFDAGKVYVCYCDLSLKSAHLAEEMQAHGLRAHYLRMSTVRSLANTLTAAG